MDLWQLKIFVSVVEHKSFSKASKAIHLSQPTVSSHIKELEAYFECRLLDRLGKTTEPTRAGRLLFEYAKKLLALKETAESAMHDYLGRLKGALQIGASTIPSAFILPEILGPFAKEYPQIDLQLTSKDTMQIISDLKAGKLEVGIVGAKVEDPHLIQKKIIEDEMKLIVPKGHKWFNRKSITIEDLLKEPLIAREKGSGTWACIIQGMENAGISADSLNIRITMDNTLSVIQGIINHIGISILSMIAVRNEIESQRVSAVTITGLNLNRHFYLTYASRREPSALCKTFIDHSLGFFSS